MWMVSRGRRTLSVAGRLGVLVLALLVLSGCVTGTDGAAQDPAAASEAELEELVRRLPETTMSVTTLDAVAAATALGADRSALGQRGVLPPLFGDDGPDPDGQLGSALVGIISPLVSPSDTAHEIIDLGLVTGVVRASTSEPFGGLVIIATGQPRDEFASAYTDAGYAPAGDEVYVLPEEPAPGDASGGYPAIVVSDGLLVLATTTDVLDRWQAATGPDDDVVAMLETAGESVAISILLPPRGAASCGESVAIVTDGTTDELLILDGGDDRLDRQAADLLGFQIGEARPDGEVTRYPLTVGDPTFAALVIGDVLIDSPPLTSC